MSFDEGNKYSVPYFVGTVGILYNTDLVNEDITKMSSMFDSKYAGKVCMLHSMRDTIGMTLKIQYTFYNPFQSYKITLPD